MAQVPDDVLAALRLKFPAGKVTVLVIDKASEVVIRKPTRPEFKRYRQLLLDPATRADGSESLMGCVLWPEPQQLEALLDEQPALEAGLAGQIAELAGNEAKIEKKAS